MDGLPIATLAPGLLTWDAALRLFARRNRAQNLSLRTQGLYAEKLGAFRRWLAANGDPIPADMTAAHLRDFIGSCQQRGLSDQTVDGFYRVLATLWRFLHRDGLTLANPMERVERPRRERRFLRPITPDQLRQVLAQIDTRDTLGLRDYALLVLLADSGLRLGEALAIRLGDVDWTGNTILVLGKGRKERRVAYGETARRTLNAWMQRRGAVEGLELLFPNRYGQRLSLVTFEQRMKGYTKAAGIAADRLSPHALRHFFALQFLRNGGDVMALQKLLGHTDLAMVRNYVNMTDDDALAKHRTASPLDRIGPLPGERRRVVVR